MFLPDFEDEAKNGSRKQGKQASEANENACLLKIPLNLVVAMRDFEDETFCAATGFDELCERNFKNTISGRFQ